MALVFKPSIIASLWSGAGTAIKAGFGVALETIGNVSTGGLTGAIRSLAPAVPAAKKDALGEVIDRYLDSLKSGGMSVWALAFIKGLLAAAGAAVTIMTAASIMAEATLIRGLRKAFVPSMPTAGEIIEGWRRGAYTNKERDEKLAELGFNGDDIQALLAQSWTVPQLQDVVRFAVREVYTPSTRAQFKMDEGADEVIKNAKIDLLRAGADEKTLRDYWAAHWNLPSANQGFEMLQRGLITEDQLAMLLRAADVMPFWREKLQGIAYAPLTRVDVRRMHKAGVLKDADLPRAYRNLGYDEKNAGLMADWTIAYNQDPESAESTWADSQAKKTRDLSASTLLDAYQDGLLTKAEVSGILTAFGYSAEEVQLQLQLKDFKRNQDRTNAQIKAIRTAYLAGRLPEKDARDLLGKFGLPDTFVQQRMEDFALERALKVEGPTKAEVIAWHKKGAIDRAKAGLWLSAMGYSEELVGLYLDGGKT